MIASTPTEVWVIVQIAIDLCLIILFVIFVKQSRAVNGGRKPMRVEQMTDSVESVLKEAQQVASQFETQLKEKQAIVKRLNERLDSRIISLNLLVDRADKRVASGENVGSEKASLHTDIYGVKQQIMGLAEKGLDSERIAGDLGISKGEVALVLDLKKKFLEMERA